MTDLMERALSHWNLQQPAWKPFLTWSQLNLDQKLEVSVIAARWTEKRMERDEELEDLANRIGDLIGLRISTDKAEAIRRLGSERV